MKLASDEYFVLGDDRENSDDSRDADIGNVKRELYLRKSVVCCVTEKTFWICEVKIYAFSVVSWSYDESKAYDAGKY